jgi:hypothetical protein
MRNGFVYTGESILEKIDFAVSGKPYRYESLEARELQTLVDEPSKVRTVDGNELLVVPGIVYNDDKASGRRDVVLSGVLYDSEGVVRAETRRPCGRIFDIEQLKNSDRFALAKLGEDGSPKRSCSVGREEGTPFQLVFDSLPSDYDSSYTIEVTTVAAARTEH